MTYGYERTIFNYLEGIRTYYATRPLVLGGVTASGGGSGGPQGGFIGRLPQTRVTYDLSEASSNLTPASGASLLDNLNHIRYRLAQLELGAITILDDGVEVGSGIDYLNFINADVTVSGSYATITASGGGGVSDHLLLTNIGTNTHAQIDTHIADYSLHEALGVEDGSNLTFSFDTGTMTLSIIPSGASFDYYYNGVKFTKTGTQTKVLTTASGMHYIYYDSNGVLQDSITPWDIQTAVEIATVYWNGTQAFIGNEQHGVYMDRKTHEYLHETVGARYAWGLAGSFTATATTIGAGEWYDEDIELDTSGDTTQIRVFYKDGSSYWKATALQAKCFHEVSDIIQYNNGTALANVDNNRFVAYWIYATNHTDSPFISIMGQRQDTTLANARANNTPDTITWGTLPIAELKLLYRVIIQRSGTTEIISDTTDYRNVTNLPATNYVATDHGTLTGLQDQDHSASAIYTLTTNFNDLLSSSDDDVQKALDTLDDHTHPIGDLETTGTPSSSTYLRGDGAWTTISGGAGGMENPMTAVGDMIYGGTSGTPTRLPIGTSGQILVVASGIPSWQTSSSSSSFIGAKVYNNADQNIPNGVTTDVTFNSEYFDTDSIHSTSVNTARLTCNTAGKYLIIAQARMASGAFQLMIRKNAGATRLALAYMSAATGGSVSCVEDLVVGDYVTMSIYNDTGAIDLKYYDAYSPNFSMVKIN